MATRTAPLLRSGRGRRAAPGEGPAFRGKLTHPHPNPSSASQQRGSHIATHTGTKRATRHRLRSARTITTSPDPTPLPLCLPTAPAPRTLAHDRPADSPASAHEPDDPPLPPPHLHPTPTH